jgi:hypothetical protein
MKKYIHMQLSKVIRAVRNFLSETILIELKVYKTR